MPGDTPSNRSAIAAFTPGAEVDRLLIAMNVYPLRGRVPVNWAIIHGETETGATLHYMTAKPDDGDIVAGTREAGGDQTADRPGAVDTDFHGVILD